MGIFLLLRLLRWWSPRSPGPLIAVVLGILLSYVFKLESAGISLVGKVPAILPSLSLPVPQGVDLGDLMQDALGIFIVSFGSGINRTHGLCTILTRDPVSTKLDQVG